jgi:subtilisin family serine protease
MRRILIAALSSVLVAAAFSGAGARADAPSPDPFEHLQWGNDLIRAPEAWAEATGEGVVIAIVDTGVDTTHPELADRWVEGASWWGCPAGSVPPCHGEQYWNAGDHGTHMAGIAAAPRDGVGIAGVAPGAKIMPVRTVQAGSVLPNLNPQDSAVSLYYTGLGIIWAVDHGADVINVSLGLAFGTTSVAAYADLWAAALDYAAAHDVLVVLAGGNNNFPVCDNTYVTPGQSTLCVGGVDPDDARSGFSNYGPGLDVVAPGGDAASCGERLPLSLYPVRFSPFCPESPGRGYDYWAGTSQATAFVTGVGALLAEQDVRGGEAAQRIRESADDLGDPGYDLQFGWGRVNAARAVGVIPPNPPLVELPPLTG